MGQDPKPISLGEGFWGREKGDYEIGDLFFDPQSFSKRGEAVKGVAAGLCLLLRHSSYSRWAGLQFREFESFLRTKNHRPAFEEDSALEKVARDLLIHLKKGLLLASFKRAWREISPLEWGASFRQRALSAQGLQREIFLPFCQRFALSWELFALEEETLVLRGALPSWEVAVLEEFVRSDFSAGDSECCCRRLRVGGRVK